MAVQLRPGYHWWFAGFYHRMAGGTYRLVPLPDPCPAFQAFLSSISLGRRPFVTSSLFLRHARFAASYTRSVSFCFNQWFYFLLRTSYQALYFLDNNVSPQTRSPYGVIVGQQRNFTDMVPTRLASHILDRSVRHQIRPKCHQFDLPLWWSPPPSWLLPTVTTTLHRTACR